MAMNYIGSVSILDRGDAPAQAVIDRNARSLAQRICDETKDELNKVMTRVHSIYGAMDTVDDRYTITSMEYVNDLSELESILKDEIKKRQYQQQVTIFIVGYSETCQQKLRLLQQVNQFFTENSKNIDEEDWFPTTPDMDLEEASNTVEDTLSHAHELSRKLAELNREMVSYMASSIEKKASNKGRKKIERALQQAREEVSGLNEKLTALQKDLDEKDEKVHNFLKQMESKNLEVQKYRTAAELAKTATDELDALRKEIQQKDAKIISQRQQLAKQEVELTQVNHIKEKTDLSLTEEFQQKITILQKELDDQKKTNEEIKKEMTRLLDNQMQALHETHRQEMEELRHQHETEAMKLQEDLDRLNNDLARSQQDLISLQQGLPEPATGHVTLSEPALVREESQAESETKATGKSRTISDKNQGKIIKSPSKSKSETKQNSHGSKPEKEFAEIAIQDEGGNPDTAMVDEKGRIQASKKQRASLKDGSGGGLDLFDEDNWNSIPTDQISDKFAQYRKLTTTKIQDLEEQLQLTTAKTKRKVATLKDQFQQHKTKWDAERKVLIEQVDQTLRLQKDAEKEADAALNQLEEFITEQEKIEYEEESKRKDIQTGASLQDSASPVQMTTVQTPGSPKTSSSTTLNPDSEQELLRLMQQTDDAKVREMNARLGTCVSAPPTLDVDSPNALKSQQVKSSEQDTSAQGSFTELPLLNISEQTYDSSASPGLINRPEPVLESVVESLDQPVAELVDLDPATLAVKSDSTDVLARENSPEDKHEALGSQLSHSKDNSAVSFSPIKDRRESLKIVDKESIDRDSTLGELDLLRDTVSDMSDRTPSLDSVKQTSAGGHTGKLRARLAKSLSSVEVSKVDGTTEEEIRASSAQSRASLRHQYKVKLGEAKLAAEDRRSKSPAIQLTTQITIDDDLILEEEEDDEFADSSVIDTSTSPLPEHKSVSRLSSLPNQEPKDPPGIQKLLSAQRVQKIITKGISLLEHPLLKEYLKVYDGVLGFKDAVGKIFLDKDYMSAHQMMSDLEAVTFDRTKKAMPQIEELTQNVLYVLEEVSSLVNSVLVFEREPPVSALNAFSRETTQQPPNEFSQDQELSPSLPKDSSVVSLQTSNLSDQLHIKELQDQYMQLQQQLEEDRRNHQEQIQHNTVVMMEMQETINDLQRELSSLEKSPMRTKSALSNGRGANVYHKSPSPEASVMFTRLDSERNAKIMKKAVMTDKLDPEKYKEAVSRMDEYVSLPAQRFVHLVQKYVHHMRMKEIEEKVKNSSSIDGEVYQVLNKMENLQNKRAKQWAKKMDEMGLERLKLANLLMDTLDNIEQESGLFLIKPMYSYHAREARPVYGRKRTVATKLRQSVVQTKDTGGSFIPAPTPANNFRHIRQDHLQQLVATSSDKRAPDPVYDNRQVKVTGNGMTSSLSSAKGMWNMQASHSWNYKDDVINSLNTPRILELDINRMLIGQNNISTKVPFPQSEDRLVNAHQNTLRSYVTVNRPTAPLGGDTTDRRPSSGRDSASSGGSSKSSKRVVISEVDREIPAAMPAAAPLPPIAPVSGPREDSQDSLGSSTEPPRSPAGSSLHPSAHDPHSRQSGRYSTPTDNDYEM